MSQSQEPAASAPQEELLRECRNYLSEYACGATGIDLLAKLDAALSVQGAATKKPPRRLTPDESAAMKRALMASVTPVPAPAQGAAPAPHEKDLGESKKNQQNSGPGGGANPAAHAPCPKCGGSMYCPCEHCATHNAGRPLWIWLEGGEVLKCPHCGHAGHADYWLDMEWAHVKGVEFKAMARVVKAMRALLTDARNAIVTSHGHSMEQGSCKFCEVADRINAVINADEAPPTHQHVADGWDDNPLSRGPSNTP